MNKFVKVYARIGDQGIAYIWIRITSPGLDHYLTLGGMLTASAFELLVKQGASSWFFRNHIEHFWVYLVKNNESETELRHQLEQGYRLYGEIDTDSFQFASNLSQDLIPFAEADWETVINQGYDRIRISDKDVVKSDIKKDIQPTQLWG